jgi:hypothetical protein
MCKVPTQAFFTEEFGLPLTMNPNFEVRPFCGCGKQAETGSENRTSIRQEA